MSPGKKFDRYMVAVELGGNAKVGRLNDSEFRCLVTGVWALAAKSPIRGALLVGEHAADANDIARQAHCTPAIARRTLHKLRDLGLLERDDELCCFVVHDWGDINPEPRNDPTAAERMRRYRERLKARNDLRNADRNAVTPAVTVTHGEVEVEEKTPLSPPEGGGAVVKFNRRPVPASRLALAEQVLADFNAQAGTSLSAYTASGKSSDSLGRIIGALTEYPDDLADLDACRRVTAAALKSGWFNGPANVGVVFGPGVVQQNIERAKTAGPRRTNVADELDRAYGRTAG